MTIVVLGSRSPRRQQILTSLLGETRLEILPPKNPDELTFDDVSDDSAIAARLQQIVRNKSQDVQDQVLKRTDDGTERAVLSADTIVIATANDGRRIVLGQPDIKHWKNQVREWFQNYLSGKTHQVWTALRIHFQNRSLETIVRTEVTFCHVTSAMLDWYLTTEESLGKAGGYAVQGHAGTFVSEIRGSLTCVIGLPAVETAALLDQAGICCWKETD
ncbi:MAG: Maf family protein [Planctomyces sp.]